MIEPSGLDLAVEVIQVHIRDHEGETPSHIILAQTDSSIIDSFITPELKMFSVVIQSSLQADIFICTRQLYVAML